MIPHNYRFRRPRSLRSVTAVRRAAAAAAANAPKGMGVERYTDTKPPKRTLSVAVASVLLVSALCACVASTASGSSMSILNAIVQTATMMGTQAGYLAESQAARQIYDETIVAPPQQLLSTSRSLNSLMSSFGPRMSSFNTIGIRSASLQQSQSLESSMYGGSSAGIHQQYSSVYGNMPQAASVTPLYAAQIDMGDSTALEALNLAETSDSAQATLTADAATELQSAGSAAPGTADMLTAQSAVLQLQSQAIEHHLLAALLRQRAIRIAGHMATVKQSVTDQLHPRIN